MLLASLNKSTCSENSSYPPIYLSFFVLRCYVDDKVSRVAWLNRSNIIFAGSDKWSLDPRVDLVTKGQLEYSLRIQKVKVTHENWVTRVNNWLETWWKTTNLMFWLQAQGIWVLFSTKGLQQNQFQKSSLVWEADFGLGSRIWLCEFAHMLVSPGGGWRRNKSSCFADVYKHLILV